MQRQTAFTRIELIVAIIVTLVLVSIFVSIMTTNPTARRIACLNNLKGIGTDYRIWQGDQADRIPVEQRKSLGGWGELFTNTDEGPNCWFHYALMGKELGLDPKLLVCPTDERRPAKDFKTDFKDNTHLSYFVGVSAGGAYPQSIQGGDRNLGPGTVPDPDYGYSPKSGKGNDVAIPISGSVSWSLRMHSSGNTAGAGNILMGDGSGQQVSSAGFSQNWLRNAKPTTNWPAGHVASPPSIRLIFP